jgi:hypothetical protein
MDVWGQLQTIRLVKCCSLLVLIQVADLGSLLHGGVDCRVESGLLWPELKPLQLVRRVVNILVAALGQGKSKAPRLLLLQQRQLLLLRD